MSIVRLGLDQLSRMRAHRSVFMLSTALLLLAAVAFFGAVGSRADTSAVSIHSDAAGMSSVAYPGSVVTLSFTNTDAAVPAVSIAGHAVQVYGTAPYYAAAYALQATDAAGIVPFSIQTGSGSITTTSDNSSVTFSPASSAITTTVPTVPSGMQYAYVNAAGAVNVVSAASAAEALTIADGSLAPHSGVAVVTPSTPVASVVALAPAVSTYPQPDTTPAPTTAAAPAVPSAPASSVSASPTVVPDSSTPVSTPTMHIGTTTPVASVTDTLASTTASTTSSSTELSDSSRALLWAVLIIVLLILIGGGWWYARNANAIESESDTTASDASDTAKK